MQRTKTTFSVASGITQQGRSWFGSTIRRYRRPQEPRLHVSSRLSYSRSRFHPVPLIDSIIELFRFCLRQGKWLGPVGCWLVWWCFSVGWFVRPVLDLRSDRPDSLLEKRQVNLINVYIKNNYIQKRRNEWVIIFRMVKDLPYYNYNQKNKVNKTQTLLIIITNCKSLYLSLDVY